MNCYLAEDAIAVRPDRVWRRGTGLIVWLGAGTGIVVGLLIAAGVIGTYLALGRPLAAPLGSHG
jgi:hypothetical protein